MSEDAHETGRRLNELLDEAGLEPLGAAVAEQFGAYCALLMRWNAKLNLTSIRDEESILRRHFAESIACARMLPAGIGTLLDLGSGAGFPGIPIALCRPEMAVTLAESQGKKAAFLQEALRTVGVGATVHAGRAETLTMKFDCVALRAVDRMGQAVGVATERTREWLAVMTTHAELPGLAEMAGARFVWQTPIALPGGTERVLALGRRQD